MGLNEIQKLKVDADKPKDKKSYHIPQKSKKRLAKEKAERDARGDNDTELQKWFKGRMKYMTGFCAECGAITETKNYALAIRSICHILPKNDNGFPSVKFHPFNWIELCWGCHSTFDNFLGWEQKMGMRAWPIIEERILGMEASLTELGVGKLPKTITDRFGWPFLGG